MAQTKQAAVTLSDTVSVIEQRIAAGDNFDGLAPAIAAAFTPYFDDTDGVYRWGAADGSTFEGTHGGLYVLDYDGPIILEQVLGSLGDATDFTVSIVTATGEVNILEATAPCTHISADNLKWRLLPGERIKIVSNGATVALWFRIYVRPA